MSKDELIVKIEKALEAFFDGEICANAALDEINSAMSLHHNDYAE